ncbi:MAG: Rid family hydrolase [Thermoplasmatota archaeon]
MPKQGSRSGNDKKDVVAKNGSQKHPASKKTQPQIAQISQKRTKSAASAKSAVPFAKRLNDQVIARVADARPAPAPAPSGRILAGFIVPGLPHPYLIPDASPSYRRIRDAYESVRKQVAALKPDLILLYSTQWLSVIGHQVQARPAPEWNHVDPEWHELGSIPYKLRMDAEFGAAYGEAGQRRGLEMRTVDYHGFPIDTGTVVALRCITPKNEVPASVVSCNMYADRAETIVLGKAALDAVQATGKRAVVVAVTNLSNRMHTDVVPFEDDCIHSLKDDEWNRKYLEFLGRGRLEDASQLAREFSSQANGDQKMKAIWWLAAVMGSHNQYDGRVFAYEPVYGTGAALVGLTPTLKAAADKEFDEDSAEFFGGDRNVLAPASGGGATQLNVLTMEEGDKWEGHVPAKTEGPRGGSPLLQETAPRRSRSQVSQSNPPKTPKTQKPSRSASSASSADRRGVVTTSKAPKPYAAYAHARRVGDTLYLAGIGPRDPKTNATVGGKVYDESGKRLKYDAKAQTRQTIENIRTILHESGCDLSDVFDVSAFLIDMKRDFAAFNEVYNEYFGAVQPARTTVEVQALPGPIAVELKVVAKVPIGPQ